ncbi:hypothetical protein ARALYDRAFT_901217 [Arabidopsis lyrata subsp. lyrata]|uniref:IBR domain-containing protein n=1 Tax=Arabidopsis lyrata subsp. lyrata TaxID=81972 RepID=D7LBF3_ARALL|nr:hypothetical protein ARALYDRAFT_901217 [Arabidopsis lyrata subsp. lyrata]
MESSDVVLLANWNDVNFAFKLAREAEQGDICVICSEETVAERMFFNDKCLHRHCFSCVKNHVKAKLDSGNVKFLTPELIEMWKQKMREDSIPAEERIYCPYPKCSILMSKTELSRSANEASDQSNVRTCIKCCGLFCIDCKVPSHSVLS